MILSLNKAPPSARKLKIALDPYTVCVVYYRGSVPVATRGMSISYTWLPGKRSSNNIIKLLPKAIRVVG
jgi:hypothetical protein